MCVYSMVSDWGIERYPYPGKIVHTVTPITPPYDGPTRKEWEDFKELVKKAIEYDKRTGQPDCVDPIKEKWFKEMEELMKRKPK